MCAHADGIAASFKLHIQCQNCMDRSVRRIDVPEDDEAPRDEDEFLESAYLKSIRFTCRRCDGGIWALVALSKVRPELEAA